MKKPSNHAQREFFSKASRARRVPIHGPLAIMLTVWILFAAPWSAHGQGGSTGDKVFNLDMRNCAGFIVDDAARILDLPVSRLAARTQKLESSSWTCTFSAPDGKGVSFTVSVSENARKASNEMEQLRGNLELAAGTAPFKDKLPGGAYSEISGPGLGDESVWTDVNGTLTVRKGNITVQVLMPSGKMGQIRVAQAFLAKF